MGLVGLVFNLFTFPGLLVNQVIQGLFEDRYGAPTSRLAVPMSLDWEAVEDDPDILSEIRELEPDEAPRADETLEFVVDYEALEEYSSLFGLVVGPFVLTSVLAVVLFAGLVGAESAGVVSLDTPWLWILAFYPGFAVAAHAFPNSEPTDALWRRSQQSESLLQTVSYPLVGLSKVMSSLRVLWVGALYAVVLYLLLAVLAGVV